MKDRAAVSRRDFGVIAGAVGAGLVSRSATAMSSSQSTEAGARSRRIGSLAVSAPGLGS